MCSSQPLSAKDLYMMFDQGWVWTRSKPCWLICKSWHGRGIELVEVGSGWRFQTKAELRPLLERLHPEKPPKLFQGHAGNLGHHRVQTAGHPW